MIHIMQPNKCVLCDSFSGKQNDTTCQVEINVSLKKEVPIFISWLGVEFDISEYHLSCALKTKQNVIDEVLGRKPTSNFSTLALWAFFSNIFLDRWSDTFGCPTYCQKRKKNVVYNKNRTKMVCECVKNDIISVIAIHGYKI